LGKATAPQVPPGSPRAVPEPPPYLRAPQLSCGPAAPRDLPGDPTTHRHAGPRFCLWPTAVPRQRLRQQLSQRLPPATARKPPGERGGLYGERWGDPARPHRLPCTGSAVSLPKAGAWRLRGLSAPRPAQAETRLVAVTKAPLELSDPFEIRLSPCLGNRMRTFYLMPPMGGLWAASAPLAPLSWLSRVKARKTSLQPQPGPPAVPSPLPGQRLHRRPHFQPSLQAIAFATADNQL